jgi:hypothetical protein
VFLAFPQALNFLDRGTNMIDETEKITVRDALNKVLSLCDGAHSRDGVGFNGYDTNFAQSLASKANWTYPMAKAIYKMLFRYRVQLLKLHGIDYAAIIVPDESAFRAKSKPTVKADFFVKRSTDKALLVQGFFNQRLKELWLPKSQILSSKANGNGRDAFTFELPEWLAKQSGLV